jgi:hypothetical protein
MNAEFPHHAVGCGQRRKCVLQSPEYRHYVSRQMGVPNKLTTGAKEVIAQVAENIGGVARMTKWVRESKENERVFWSSIYIKLLPLQVTRTNPSTELTKSSV